MNLKIGDDILWLSETDVAHLLTMDDTLVMVEKAFGLHGQGKVQLPPKVYLDFKPFGGDLRAMPVYIQGKYPAAGVKIVNSNSLNPDQGLPAVAGIVVYNDPRTGMPLGVFAAGTLTSLRTGAGGGIAAKYLARADSKIIGLVGCGRQAHTQVDALLRLFPIERVFVWGKTMQEAKMFCDTFQPVKSVSITPFADLKPICGADIVVTTTPVRKPLVKAAWIKPGTHINAIGADAPGKQELEIELLKKSSVVVDDWNQASHAGEINVACAKGKFHKKNVYAQLGEIVAGKKKGRVNDKQITIFDSTGLALQDIAVAQWLYNKAVSLNKGQVLKLHG